MFEFNFKSQPATSIEQSERLLALGLKKEPADMVHYFSQSLAQDWIIVPLANGETARYIQGLEIPAWSLGRLLEVMRMKASSQIVPLDDTFDRLIEGIETRIKEAVKILKEDANIQR